MKLLPNLRYGTRSLKTTLALYFIPISIIPALSISFYAISIFEESGRETLARRAISERDAIISEIDALESGLLEDARSHSKMRRLVQAVREKDVPQIEETVRNFRAGLMVRVYSPNGTFIGGRRLPQPENRIVYLSKEGLRRVRARGETIDRYFAEDGKGFVTLIRTLLKEKDRPYGILEEEYRFGQRDFANLKNRRQVDVVLLNRELNAAGASFALSSEILKNFSRQALQSSLNPIPEPVFVEFGDDRFAAFLYDLPAQSGKNKKWGYFAVFLSMTTIDATVVKLKLAIVYLTVLLVLIAALAIFIFSNRLVKPIVILVSAMKRVKSGREEQVPALDSTYEIEYLVSSFNDMSRNVSSAKRTLEQKLEELHRVNAELKATQSTLVQSAKMISLGQIVAGVAHELNNPIAFIYSNMHHLSEYLEKIKELVRAYRESVKSLPVAKQSELAAIEKQLDIEFILKDMESLTQSCLDGANRTKEIVLGLRTFSRIDESTFRAADIHEGIRSTLRLLVSELKDRITVHEEWAELPHIECNLSQMNQVFMNLLSNSAQAIQGNGDIWIRTRRDGEFVVIEIEDNGCGMPPEVQEKIFDPFFTTKRVGQGTGLGLSIAYGLVQKHHGSIGVESRVGEGTRFNIRLPIRQPVQLTA